MKPDEVRAQIAALEAAYSRELPARISAVRDAVASDGGLERARMLAHQLAGTAGSYGFRGVSDAVRTVERALEASIARDGALSTSERESIARALDEASRAAVAR